ncbi:MAG: glycerol-3-phosphate 1-O-acyltransferase PlsY [Bacteroidia bacterium]|nr:glycerol-3-phosphate 1-O-acyltransferase PlsY [Bacteroidia bacterium]MBP9688748.1 glycerol-3-phosphate 1-O-acyltransferase PlsY [Bacteroidia bacterium]
MNQQILIYVACVVAYLLGSIPSSVWVGKIFFGVDVREHGSGNAGATNTLRVLGKPAGFTVLFLDFFKGIAAASLVLYSGVISNSNYLIEYKMLFGALAVIGHIYPVFAGFRGGKGIATVIGVVAGMDWQLALACFITFVIIVAITKYISVGSMLSGLISPLYAGLIHNWEEKNLVYFCMVVGVLVVYTHRANIKRLRKGEESRFSLAKKPTQIKS